MEQQKKKPGRPPKSAAQPEASEIPKKPEQPAERCGTCGWGYLMSHQYPCSECSVVKNGDRCRWKPLGTADKTATKEEKPQTAYSFTRKQQGASPLPEPDPVVEKQQEPEPIPFFDPDTKMTCSTCKHGEEADGFETCGLCAAIDLGLWKPKDPVKEDLNHKIPTCSSCRFNYIEHAQYCLGCIGVGGMVDLWKSKQLTQEEIDEQEKDKIMKEKEIEPITLKLPESYRPLPDKAMIHIEICQGMTDLYIRKNADYGDSFAKFRKEIPEAILVRIYDKYSRLKTLIRDEDRKVEDETIEDTLTDLANYCILELIERKVNR